MEANAFLPNYVFIHDKHVSAHVFVVASNLDSKPNFHVSAHWEWYIKEYGMPRFYDSERHENKHQDPKHDTFSGRADLYDQLVKSESR